MGCVYSKPEPRARDDEVSRVSRRERRLWQALLCCFKGNGTGGYEPLAKTLELEEPEHKQHGSSHQSLTHRENLQQKLAKKEGGVRQPLELQQSKRNELQTKESQISVPDGQITDIEDMKNKLIAAKEQELQLLRCITAQQEEHKQKMTEKEAEFQHLQQSLERQVSGRNELQTKITGLEGQIAVLQGQITDLEDAEDKLIVAKEQELQDERDITTQQEDHKQSLTEKEAEFQQSLQQYKGQLLLPAEQDTDLKELDTDLKTVCEWFRFGINLDVPDWKLLEIQENKRGVIDACRLQVLMEWGKMEKRTWRKVVRALLAVGRTRLARELAEKYGVPLQQNVDDTSSLQHVASTSSEGQLQESSQGCKEEVQELFEGLIKEREQQIKNLEVKLEAKKEQIAQLWQEMEERKAELFQKTMQLEEVTKQVQKLEGEKEQLRSQWVSESMTLHRELWQQVAKTTSQAAYIQQVRTWLSNAMEMVMSKDKEAADYRQQISQKEEEITVLSERIRHHEAGLHRILMESCGTTVVQASSKETLEAFHEEVSQMVETSELKMRPEKEKQRLELKEETTLQDVVCRKEEISWLSLDCMKCMAVGSGLELTEAQQLSKFRVHLADIDGNPCVINQDVTAELTSIVNGSQVKAEVVSKTPAIYEISYQPATRGRHDLSVRVNGTPIQGSPFGVYVRKPPHLMSEPVREIDTEHMIEDITTTRNGDVVVCGDNEVFCYARGGQRIKTIKLDFGSIISLEFEAELLLIVVTTYT